MGKSLKQMLQQSVSHYIQFILMDQIDQTLCPSCKLQYSDSNPPRLLTMCGHTFCQSCIKNMFPKKKVGGKMKIVCPIDKKTIELINSNPTNFPKNIVVINLLHNKKEDIENKDLIESVTLDKYLPPNAGKNHVISEKVQQVESEQIGQAMVNMCLLHQKTLDLVCVRDCKRVCSSCVIFGQHRGHSVKNSSQLNKMGQLLQQQLRYYIKQHNNSFNRLQQKQLSIKIQSIITSKKQETQKQIHIKFKQLLNKIIQQQKKTIQNLDKTIKQIKQRTAAQRKQKIKLKQNYQEWINNVYDKINVIKSENEQQKLSLILKSDAFMEMSQNYVQFFKSLNTSLISDVEAVLDNVRLVFDADGISKSLKEFCRLEDTNQKFIDLDISKVNIAQTMNQQILLDDLQQTYISSEITRRSGRSVDKINKISSNSWISDTKDKINDRKGIKSTERQNLSFSRANSKVRPSKLLSMSSVKLTGATNPIKIKQIPQKYEAKISQVLKGESDTLDLTNAQLGDKKVMSILKSITNIPILIAKLVKNKLTDQFLSTSLDELKSIKMLNLSKNELTQRSLNLILTARKEGKLDCLKSLMLGQNKIVERNHRQTIEQLRKTGVNVCM